MTSRSLSPLVTVGKTSSVPVPVDVSVLSMPKHSPKRKYGSVSAPGAVPVVEGGLPRSCSEKRLWTWNNLAEQNSLAPQVPRRSSVKQMAATHVTRESTSPPPPVGARIPPMQVSSQEPTTVASFGIDQNCTTNAARQSLTNAFCAGAPLLTPPRSPAPVFTQVPTGLAGDPLVPPPCRNLPTGPRTDLSAMPQIHNVWSAQVVALPTRPNPLAPLVSKQSPVSK